MLSIAPLDYERYAVLISLPPPPETIQSGVSAPTRAAEPIGAPSAASSRGDYSSGAQVRNTGRQFVGVAGAASSRDPEHLLNGPHPSSLTRLAGPPPVILSLMAGERDVTPQQVSALYDRPDKSPPPTIDIRA